jgi:hypothetical protein
MEILISAMISIGKILIAAIALTALFLARLVFETRLIWIN